MKKWKDNSKNVLPFHPPDNIFLTHILLPLSPASPMHPYLFRSQSYNQLLTHLLCFALFRLEYICNRITFGTLTMSNAPSLLYFALLHVIHVAKAWRNSMRTVFNKLFFGVELCFAPDQVQTMDMRLSTSAPEKKVGNVVYIQLTYKIKCSWFCWTQTVWWTFDTTVVTFFLSWCWKWQPNCLKFEKLDLKMKNI